MGSLAKTARADVLTLLDDPVAMALAVIFERVRHLNPDDRTDFYELIGAYPRAENQEARQSIQLAIREVLSQEPMVVKRFDLDDIQGPAIKLRTWIEFISRKVRQVREEAGVTQVELAEQSGLPQSHLSRIENGKLSPSHLTLKKIAKGLNRKVTDFDLPVAHENLMDQ